MNRDELNKLYIEKLDEMDKQRRKLNDMYELGKALTEPDVVRQNVICEKVGLEVMDLKEMLEEEEQ